MVVKVGVVIHIVHNVHNLDETILMTLRPPFHRRRQVELEILINHNCGGDNGGGGEEDIVQKKLKVSF